MNPIDAHKDPDFIEMLKGFSSKPESKLEKSLREIRELRDKLHPKEPEV